MAVLFLVWHFELVLIIVVQSSPQDSIAINGKPFASTQSNILYIKKDLEHRLDPLLFEIVGQSAFVEQYKDEVKKSLLDEFLIKRINAISLEQGTAG